MTVCFTGHRPKSFDFGFNEQHPQCIRIKELITHEIESLIVNYSADTFYSGMALGVDTWAAEAVIALKEKYPFIKLIAAIPFPDQSSSWSEDNKERYNNILEKCDSKVVTSPHYHRGCMHIRNRYMVDRSDIVMAVLIPDRKSGTASTLSYAEKKKKMLVSIYV